jgi:hypothetical protein
MLVFRSRFCTYPNSFVAFCEDTGMYGTVVAIPTDVSIGGGWNGRIGTALDGRCIDDGVWKLDGGDV